MTDSEKVGVFKIFRKSTRKSKCRAKTPCVTEKLTISHPTNFQETLVDIDNLRYNSQESPFIVSGNGNLLLMDQFKQCSTKKQLTVFLFENICLFTMVRNINYFYLNSLCHLSISNDYNTLNTVI